MSGNHVPKFIFMSLTILLNRTFTKTYQTLGGRQCIYASEIAKVKSWNRIIKNIQNNVKISVHTTYFSISQYMICNTQNWALKNTKAFKDALIYIG
jgi:hypothetical protein